MIKKYDRLVLELTSYIAKYHEISELQKSGEFDLKWRLTELYKDVKEEDEQKFIELSGLHGYLLTSKEKKSLLEKSINFSSEKNKSDNDILDVATSKKSSTEKTWVKSLYRRSVRRCHPDIIRKDDSQYKEDLINIYKSINESYENDNLDILMIEAYKLLVKPKEVSDDQIEILEVSKKDYHEKIKKILASQGYAWSNFDSAMKESFLINLMKQKGVRFVDKNKIKEVLKRKVSSRKIGQKPKNKLRHRVKNKK